MRRISTKALVTAGVVIALLLAGVVSFYASGSPDGLERVAEDQGFGHTAEDSPVGDSPLADYGTRGIENERLSTAVAGVAGVGLTLAAGAGLASLTRRRSRGRERAEATPTGAQE